MLLLGMLDRWVGRAFSIMAVLGEARPLQGEGSYYEKHFI